MFVSHFHMATTPVLLTDQPCKHEKDAIEVLYLLLRRELPSICLTSLFELIKICQHLLVDIFHLHSGHPLL